MKKRPSLDEIVQGIVQQNRIILSRAITITESKLSEDQALAGQIIDKILPKTGKSIRVGITGVPGVGKSTFIEVFGKHLTNQGKRVAVLSIDPTSSLTKGSILGDKTRMPNLSNDPNAYIRPSASGTSLGGVAFKTRETILLCEAAGYDVIIVETVGVGQSETAVKDMVDFFLLLMLAGGGDELQGIKRGIMEMADALIINKADGENMKAANLARKAYTNALHLFPPPTSGWKIPVALCSAKTKSGIENIWEMICHFKEQTTASGFFSKQRQGQNLKWMYDMIHQKLESDFYQDKTIQQRLSKIENEVAAGKLSARHAVKSLFSEK